MILAAGLIWALTGGIYGSHGPSDTAVATLCRNLLAHGELLSILLAAMTYMNAMEERAAMTT